MHFFTGFNTSDMYDILLRDQFFRDLEFDMADFRSNMFYRVVTKNSDVIKKSAPEDISISVSKLSILSQFSAFLLFFHPPSGISEIIGTA